MFSPYSFFIPLIFSDLSYYSKESLIVKRRYSLGLHVGAHAFTWVELSKTAHDIHFIHHQTVALPLSQDVSLKCFSKQAHLSVASDRVMEKRIAFQSPITDRQMANLIKRNTEMYLPNIKESLLSDFVIDRHDHFNVAIFSVRESDVVSMFQLTHALKIKVVSIEPDTYALLRAIQFNGLVSKSMSAFLYRESDHFRVLIFRGDRVVDEERCALPFQYIAARYDPSQLEGIYMFGDIDSDKPVVSIDPFSTFYIPASEKNDGLLIAFGLALRGFV